MAEIDQLWERIDRWLADHAPATLASLNPPASASDLAEVETALGRPLPEELTASLRHHNGTDEHLRTGRFALAGYMLLSTSQIVARWQMIERLLADTPQSNRDALWQSHWVPFATSVGADMLYLDQPAGAPEATVGTFVHDDFPRPREWPSYSALLDQTAHAIETGTVLDLLRPTIRDSELWWIYSPDESA
jgi:cell wall assembly regulator SMI1